jgi:Undecaprenyl-phosphate galactose phosphotransferase WbaP
MGIAIHCHSQPMTTSESSSVIGLSELQLVDEGPKVSAISNNATHENGAFRQPPSGLAVMSPGLREFVPSGRAAKYNRVLNNRATRRLLSSGYTIWKRVLDVSVALVAGIFLLPLILIIAAAVKLTSPGHLFYGHLRVGRNNARFRVWKFRTMVNDADTLLAERLATDPLLQIEWDRDQKLRQDPRLTPIGKLLRRFSLDELPQLWNVIKGEMSVVGPRPICEAEIAKYREYFADYTKVLPGISGLWQVSGRNETTYPYRVYLDTYYVNNWSLLLDLRILLRTVKAVLTARGAY